MTHTEGNAIIARYMGLKMEIVDKVNYPNGNHEWKVILPGQLRYEIYGSEDHALEKANFKYHSSFDWLMPVVERIGKSYDVVITTSKTEINRRYDPASVAFGLKGCICRNDTAETMIERTYSAVLQFINEENK